MGRTVIKKLIKIFLSYIAVNILIAIIPEYGHIAIYFIGFICVGCFIYKLFGNLIK